MEEQNMLQAETYFCQQCRRSTGSILFKAISENNKVQFFHSSAVKLAKAEAILCGILPALQGILHLETTVCISST